MEAPFSKALSQGPARSSQLQEMSSIGAGKPFPPSLPDPGEYTVDFESIDDPLHPQNWPVSKKYSLIVSTHGKNGCLKNKLTIFA